MADKISTVVLKVDLECEKCYKKIRRVLCRLQDKANIKTISFDEKSQTVTVSGPFDPEKLCTKLCSEAGNVIRELQIKGKEKLEKDSGKPKEKDRKPEPEKEAKPEKAKEGKKEKGDKADKKVRFEEAEPDAKPAKAKARADAAPAAGEKVMLSNLEPEPPRGEPMAMMAPAAQRVAVPSIWPAAGPGVCCYQPAYEAYYGGGCRCCSCGKVAGWGGGAAAAPPPAGGYYGVPVYDQGWYNRNAYPYQQGGEDPNAACSIM